MAYEHVPEPMLAKLERHRRGGQVVPFLVRQLRAAQERIVELEGKAPAAGSSSSPSAAASAEPAHVEKPAAPWQRKRSAR